MMTVDESIENLKAAVEAFERLRVGLVPFVEDTVTQKFPNLGLEDLKALSREISLREMPDTYASMDIAAILNLMETHGIRDRGQNKPDVLDAFRAAFGGKVANLMGSLRTLKNYRNRAAHHNGLADRQLTLNQVREVLATAATWLEAIADRYPAAKEQLAKLEAMQADIGRPATARIPETMADYYAINPGFRAAVTETIQRQVGASSGLIFPPIQQDDPDRETTLLRTSQEASDEILMPADSESESHIKAEIEALNQAINMNPGDTRSYWDRGIRYHSLQWYELAIADFNQVIEVNPQASGAYMWRGSCCFTLQRYEEASYDFTQAIRLNPQNDVAYYERGRCHLMLRQYEEALANFDQTISIDPQDAAAYYERGRCYFTLQRYEQAIADLDQAIVLDPQIADAYFYRGFSYFEFEQYEQAVADFGQTISINPQDVAAYDMRGLSRVNLGQYEQAIEDYSQAIGLYPEYDKAYNNRGLCYAELRKFDQALADFSQAIAFNPQESAAYINRGLCYTELQYYREAVADFATAIDINPTAQLHRARGEAYEAWGNEAPLDDQSQLFEQALADYEEADRLRDTE